MSIAPNDPTAPRLLRWPAVWLRLSVVATVFMVAVGLFFWLDHPGASGEQLASMAVVYGAFLVAVSVPIAWGMCRPLTRLQALLDSGVATTALPPRDVIASLRMPERIFGGVLGAGVLVAFGATWTSEQQTPPTAPWQVFFLGGLAIAVISAAAHTYALRRLVFTRVAPILLPGGRLDHLGDVPLTPTWHHLSALAATLGIAWPALGYLVLRFGESPSPTAAAVMFLLYLAQATHQIAGVMESVSRPVGHLRDRMVEVGGGSLEVQSRIDALDTFGRLSSEFNRMVEGLKQREILKETFGRYVTKQVADEILSGRLALGGERRVATVLFSDIRGFTSMSEQLSPEEVVAFLNEYLTTMVDCVLEHGGVLDKFIGDAVLAVFGAPVSAGSPEQDARAAVACARAMGVRLDALNAARATNGHPPIRIGIGVHTGELVAGNIGSPKRMQYTVVGDTVNVGSRLESLTKEHRRRTLLSGATAALMRDVVGVEELGTVPVRGRVEPLAIYGFADERPTPAAAPADEPAPQP